MFREDWKEEEEEEEECVIFSSRGSSRFASTKRASPSPHPWNRGDREGAGEGKKEWNAKSGGGGFSTVVIKRKEDYGDEEETRMIWEAAT